MPILSAFIVGLLFKNVDARAVIIAAILGVLLYTIFTQVWPKLPGGNYIHMMAITLVYSVTAALGISSLAFGKIAKWDAHTVFGKCQYKAIGSKFTTRSYQDYIGLPHKGLLNNKFCGLTIGTFIEPKAFDQRRCVINHIF